MKHQISLRVRFAETDAMGVVYHSRYFEYMEMARVSLMDQMGLPYCQLAGAGWHLPVLEIQAKYLRSARFDDKLTVEVWLERFNGLRMEMRYNITRGSELILEGMTKHAFVNTAGKPCRPPKEVADKFAALLNS